MALSFFFRSQIDTPVEQLRLVYGRFLRAFVCGEFVVRCVVNVVFWMVSFERRKM